MDMLHSTGELDTLPYYAEVASTLKEFLKGLEIATRIWLPNGMRLLKRGSKLEPLYIDELAVAVDQKMLELRHLHLDEARPDLTLLQDKVWQYFFPRKFLDFLYNTNGEGEGRPISRLFFDIDRSNLEVTKAQEVAGLLVREIESSDLEYKSIFPMWTGKSFHVYVLLRKTQPCEFYEEHIQCAEDSETMAMGWVRNIASNCDFNVVGGHEKVKNAIIIDPSQTPSGKLARAPFSLHIASPKKVDGVALPLTMDLLEQSDLIPELNSYTPDRVIEELDQLAKRIPKP